MIAVFLSVPLRERELGSALAERIRALGLTVWSALGDESPDDAVPADMFRTNVDLIRGSDVFVAVLGSHGRDLAAEVGMAHAWGMPSLGIDSGGVRDVMVHQALDRIVEPDGLEDALLEAVGHVGHRHAHELWAQVDLATAMAVRVAATLRIADHIAEGRRTAPELADAAGADADALDRLLRHLVAAEVLRWDGAGRYALTPRGDALRDDHPAGIRAVLDVEGAIGRGDLSFVELLHTVRTGEPAFPVRYGRSFWDDLSADPARSASFAARMGSDVGADAPAIVSAYDWGSLGHVVDVGGGNGALMAAMLHAHPGLRGTVLDLPDTVEAARKTLSQAGLADRSDVVAGSFFDALPAGAGGYVLSAILHDWDDDAARAILRRCAEAAGADGAVFVVEKIGADGRSPRTGMDLRVLAYFGGRERDVAEIDALAQGCDLQVAAVHPAGAIAVMELVAVHHTS